MAQLRAPCIHSWIRPQIKIIVKINRALVNGRGSRILGARAKGSRRETSTSKIKKIIVMMKNRREKGLRAFFEGSNPHSKGEAFSRSFKVFFLIMYASAAMVKDNSMDKV